MDRREMYEASFHLIDPMNPGCGYQVVITDGQRREVLRTAYNPGTGADLLTYNDCVDVLQMYRTPAYDVLK